jgi:Predicted transcriptional regulators
MDVDYKAIGKRIKIARIKKDITQDQVANITGLSNPHISNIENGSTKVSLPTLIKLANVLSVSVDELLCDNVIHSKIIYNNEISDAVNGCNDREIRVVAEIVKVTVSALRHVSIIDD